VRAPAVLASCPVHSCRPVIPNATHVTVLEAEEARHEFDIQNYGRDIITRLQQQQQQETTPAASVHSKKTLMEDNEEEEGGKGSVFSFSSVLPPGAAPRYEVCRSFLATLQVRGEMEYSLPCSSCRWGGGGGLVMPRG
jgi:hypothetical protein